MLAGGGSRRLAGSVDPRSGKAAIEVGGETLLGRVCSRAAAVVRRVIVVAAPGQVLPALTGEIEVVRDSSPGAGPLAAIRDGLRRARADDPAPRTALVLSCDLPLLGDAVLRLLVAEAAASAAAWVLPVVGGHPQVLVSAVSTGLLQAIEDAVARGVGGPRGFLDEFVRSGRGTVRMVRADELAVVDPALESFFDVDTPEDLARLSVVESRLRGRPG